MKYSWYLQVSWPRWCLADPTSILADPRIVLADPRSILADVPMVPYDPSVPYEVSCLLGERHALNVLSVIFSDSSELCSQGSIFP